MCLIGKRAISGNLVGRFVGNIESEKQDACDQFLAACLKVPLGGEMMFAPSILVSLGLTVNHSSSLRVFLFLLSSFLTSISPILCHFLSTALAPSR